MIALRRADRRQQHVPGADEEVRDGLGDGRQVLESRRPLQRGGREPLDQVALDRGREPGIAVEHQRHAAAHHVVHRLRRAAGIGHELKLDAGARLQQLHGQMREPAAAGRRVGHLAGLLLRHPDDVGDGVDAGLVRGADVERLLQDDADRRRSRAAARSAGSARRPARRAAPGTARSPACRACSRRSATATPPARKCRRRRRAGSASAPAGSRSCSACRRGCASAASLALPAAESTMMRTGLLG